MNRWWHFIMEETIEFSSTSPFEWAFVFQNRSSQSKVRILRHLFWNSKHLKMFKMSEISNFWMAGPILENKGSFERARWAEFNELFFFDLAQTEQKLYTKHWPKKSRISMFFKCSTFTRKRRCLGGHIIHCSKAYNFSFKIETLSYLS